MVDNYPSLQPLPFYCPVPEIPPPSSNAIDARSVQWMLDLGMCERTSPMTRNNVGSYAALMYPFTLNKECLQIATDLLYFGFAYDDTQIANPELCTTATLAPAIGKLLAVLDAPEAPTTDPYERGLLDIITRLQAAAGLNMALQVADDMRKYLLCSLWQHSLWERGLTPALSDYMSMRIRDTGGTWVATLTAACGGYDLPASIQQHPRARAAAQAVILTATLDNDIFSFHREDAEGQKNAVHILLPDCDNDLARALAASVTLRNRLMLLYTRLRDEPEDTETRPVLYRYIHDLGHIVRGNLQWHQSVTHRYDTGKPPLCSPVWTDDGSDIDASPLPLTSIAWWWDLLCDAA